jgi:hypothetical protein
MGDRDGIVDDLLIDPDVLAEMFPAHEGEDEPRKSTVAARERAEAHYDSVNTREELVELLASELDEYAGAAVRARDAQWRDALRGNYGEEFWRRSGPQNPSAAIVFERESRRVDGVWRDWMIGERDRMRDLLKMLLASAQKALASPEEADDELRQAVDAVEQALRPQDVDA